MPVIVGDGSGDSQMNGDGKGVSVGSTDNTGRNAGVSTATGTVIYNSSTTNFEGYIGDEWVSLSENFSSTGGTKIESGTDIFHIFTSSGSLVVGSNAPTKRMEFIVVGAGGAGRAGVGS